MRYRKQSSTGDYTFGFGQADFLINNPECVAQAVKTRLLLLRGEWFLDIDDGTPYADEILGKSNAMARDQAVRARILGTENVTEIVSYFSELVDRNLSITATINTAFGQTTVRTIL